MVAYSIILGKNTISKIRQNIGWAIGYNSVLIPIAAGLLVPLFGLSIFSILPILAALAMGLSSTSVVLNSLRLRSKITRSVNRITLFNKETKIMKRDLPGGA
jgi:Cu2+-exporting ATPase/Cu+-exporting ATPase